MAPLARQGARRLRLVAATGTIIALGLAGVTAMGDAQPTHVAVPAASTAAPQPYAQRSERPDRGAARPSLPATASPAATKAAKNKTAKQKAPKQKAPKKKARTALTPSPTRTTPSRTPTPTRTPTHEPTVVGTRYTTVPLNVRIAPDDDARLVTVLAAGSKMTITDATSGSYRGIVYQGRYRWVHGQYLVRSKPTPSQEPSSSGESSSGGSSSSGSSAGVSAAPCSSGSSVESGLTPDAIRVHRAVCHAFPQITSYGGVRSGGFGEHGSGRAVDCMLPNGSADNALGWQVARWVRAHAGELGVSQVIFDQHIWTVQRSSEGWRSMSDRGSDTANHRDHVHVTVYGSSGTS